MPATHNHLSATGVFTNRYAGASDRPFCIEGVCAIRWHETPTWSHRCRNAAWRYVGARYVGREVPPGGKVGADATKNGGFCHGLGPPGSMYFTTAWALLHAKRLTVSSAADTCIAGVEECSGRDTGGARASNVSCRPQLKLQRDVPRPPQQALGGCCYDGTTAVLLHRVRARRGVPSGERDGPRKKKGGGGGRRGEGEMGACAFFQACGGCNGRPLLECSCVVLACASHVRSAVQSLT